MSVHFKNSTVKVLSLVYKTWVTCFSLVSLAGRVREILFMELDTEGPY
jgi:hypothetical protein